MAILTNITVNFSVSPRIATVASPTAKVTVQDLWDTFQSIQSKIGNMSESSLINNLGSTGKQVLTDTRKAAIILSMNNLKLKFADRAGPSTELMEIVDGALVAIDSAGAAMSPIEPSAFTQVDRQLDQSGVLLEEPDIRLIKVLTLSHI